MSVSMYFSAFVHNSSWLNCSRIDNSPILSLFIRYGNRRLLSRSSAKSMSCFRQWSIATMALSNRRLSSMRLIPKSPDPYLFVHQLLQIKVRVFYMRDTLQFIGQYTVSFEFFNPRKGAHGYQAISVHKRVVSGKTSPLFFPVINLRLKLELQFVGNSVQ